MDTNLKCSLIVKWDKAFSIGDEKIDKEHEKLFDIANRINNSIDEIEFKNVLKELVKYTKFHFQSEENFMKAISYKHLEYHKSLHKKLVEALNELIKKVNSQSLEDSIEELSILVNKNILQHILIEDKKVHHAIKSREELKARFVWKLDYKLKNELLDKEHEHLFVIAIQALDYHDTDIKTHVKMTIKALYEYMKTHFLHEEEYMKKIAYPNYEEHKEIHENIISQMNEFIKMLPKLKIVEFEKKLIEYMDIWLINHILYEDRKIVNFEENS